MSRMNWMTYLKVQFDKLFAQANQGRKAAVVNVDSAQFLSAFLSIKRHLPLLSADEYHKRHGSERGFTSFDVQECLKRLSVTKRVLVWDDVIDIFIVKLAQKTTSSRNKAFNSELTFQS